MLLGESEVGDHRSALAEENVGQLEISVEESSRSYFDKSANNALCQFHGFLFAESLLLLEKDAEVTPVAELSDDVAVAPLPHDIVALEDMLMLKSG